MKKTLLLLLFLAIPHLARAHDLTVVGNVNYADGLGRISIGVMELLKNDLSISCIAKTFNPTDVSPDVQDIVNNSDNKPGTVSILFNPIWHLHSAFYTQVPNSKIKIAYSMFETDSIPRQWVRFLNSNFDSVVVPDPYLVGVYKECGVKIPIFVLPIGMNFEEHFAKERRNRPSDPFVFGTTVSCDERKNYPLMIQAFAEEFGDSPDVILRLNSRFGAVAQCKKQIKALGISNIVFSHDVLTNSGLLDLLDSFDCFVNFSKGEGYSLCPREAMALGIPCVLTSNTAQITICESGLVKVVPSEIKEPATNAGLFGEQPLGNFFNCAKEDVKAAMRDVYENYQDYLELADKAPEWVSQYAWEEQKGRYLSLVKPRKVILGDQNLLTDDYLMTTCEKLYQKYKKTFRLVN